MKKKLTEKSSLRNCTLLLYEEHFTSFKIEEICKNWNNINNYFFILHNKEENKKNHFHIVLTFKDSTKVSVIMNKFNIELNLIHYIETTVDSSILYLTHDTKDSEDKERYDVAEVITNYENFLAYHKQIKDKYNNKLLKNELKKNNDERLIEILELISSGKLKEYNYTNYVSVEEYAKYRTKIDNAYKYYYDKNNGINRNMEVFYISGYSGTGKTFFSKKFAMEKYKENEIYISSSGADIFGEYKGQPCVILDDLRSEMGFNGFKASDLLKLLDNNTSSSVKSRYRNKNLFNCELLIITSVLTPLQFFHNVSEEEKEEVHQFFRRCKNWLAIQKDSYNILFNIYDRDKREYFTKKHIVNKYYDDMINYIELSNNSNSFLESLDFETLAEFNSDTFIESLDKFNPFEKK